MKISKVAKAIMSPKLRTGVMLLESNAAKPTAVVAHVQKMGGTSSATARIRAGGRTALWLAGRERAHCLENCHAGPKEGRSSL